MDLADEREAVLDAIRRLQMRHDSMEFFGAHSERPLDVCLQEVRRSDILVVVVGHKYGSIASEIGISFSEAEYEEGFKLGKPCLVYSRDENVPVLPRNVEDDPAKMALLRAWKERLNQRHTIAHFTDASSLAVQVAADIGKVVQDLEVATRAGSRSNAAAEASGRTRLLALVDKAIEDGVSELTIWDHLVDTVKDLRSEYLQLRPLAFFSYHHADNAVVRELAAALRPLGVDVWLDMEKISVGDRWLDAIERGLRGADAFVVFVSQASTESRSVLHEISGWLAKRDGPTAPPVFPVLLEHPVDVPPVLRTYQWLDMSDGDVTAAAHQLARAILP